MSAVEALPLYNKFVSAGGVLCPFNPAHTGGSRAARSGVFIFSPPAATMRGMGVSLSFHEIAARTPPGILILGFSVILFLYLIAVLILGYHWHQFDLIPLRSEIKKMRRIFYTVSAMLLILMAFSLFLFAR